METLGDLLGGIKEAYGILQPYLTEVDDNTEEIVLWSSDGLEQKTKDLLESDKVQEIFGRINVNVMEDVNRILIESFAFNDAIERLFLRKDKSSGYQPTSLGITFKNGLSIVAYDPDQVYYDLGKHFEITPETPSEFHFKYEVNSKDVRTSGGFNLTADQIPERLIYPSLVDNQFKMPNNSDEEIETMANIEIANKLNRKAEEILRRYYGDIQRDLLTGKEGYWISIDHMPSSDNKPNGAVEGTVNFRPFIREPRFPNYERQKDLLKTPLSQITSRFAAIEEAVRGVYKTLNIKELEDFGSIGK